MAASAQDLPLFKPFFEQRSLACSMVLQVSTPKMIGVSVLSWTFISPEYVSPQTCL